MAEDLSTPSNTLVKMRWKEPYVSEGLNKKLNGLIPAGVVRGGKLSTSTVNSSVKILADSEFGDSVYSFIDANGHHLTFRQVGDVTLNLDVGTLPGITAYVGLEITYITSSDTVVKWRGYTQAEVDADSTIVVLGSADVPAIAALIPASDISDDRRRIAWMNISQYMREAMQVVKNGAFELSDDSAPSAGGNPWPWWDYANVTETGLSCQVIDTGTPQVGDSHLAVTLTGAGTQVFLLQNEAVSQCRGGETVKVKFWVKGSSLTPGPGSGGRMGVVISVADENPNNVIQTEYIQDLTLSGTFAYTEVERTFKLDSDARWINVGLVYDDDSNSSTGIIYFDDVRVWIEQPQTQSGQVEGYGLLSDGAIVSRSIDIAKPRTAASSLDQFIQNILTLRNDDGSDTYVMKRRPNAVQDFLLKLINGDLEVENLLTLGANKVGSAADKSLPRVSTALPGTSANNYVCLWKIESGGDDDAFLYAVYDPDAGFAAGLTYFAIVVNAEWNGTQWTRLDSGKASVRYDFSASGFAGYRRGSSESSPWADASWDDTYNTGQVELVVGGGTSVLPKSSLQLQDGVLYLGNYHASAQTNPLYSTAIQKNALYSKNVVKAWARITTLGVGGSSNSITVEDGINIASVSDFSTQAIGINFTNAFDSKDDYAYSVFVDTDVIQGGSGPPYQGYGFYSLNTSGAIALGVADDLGAIMNLRTAGHTYKIIVTVLGTQS